MTSLWSVERQGTSKIVTKEAEIISTARVTDENILEKENEPAELRVTTTQVFIVLSD